MASSSLFAAARRRLCLGRRGGLLPVPPYRAVAFSSLRNSADKGTPPARPPTLGSTLWPLGHPDILLVPEIERWAAWPGNRFGDVDLRGIVKELRTRGRYRQALEVSEWMNLKGHIKFIPKDHAVHLDLIGHIHGIEAAETYFNNLSDKHKTKKPYGGLLNCYARELLVDKALARFQKMKELGFVFTALPYNNLMNLYTNIGQHERVPSVMAEMKSNGVVPNNLSYRICINSYGTRTDFFGLENNLEEMECEPQIVVDWKTYAVVASQYIKGDLREKAYSALQKAEAKIGEKDLGAYSYLISLYTLGTNQRSRGYGRCKYRTVRGILTWTKNALYMCAPNSGWIPSPLLIEMILKYLGDEGEVKEVEAFIDLLKVPVPMYSDMTEALSRARAREEKKAEVATEAPR